MTDELARRRQQKRHAEVAARAAINRCAAELGAHGPAVVELLHAIAEVYERRAPSGKPEELHSSVLVWLAGCALGVSARQQEEIFNRIHAEEASRST